MGMNTGTGMGMGMRMGVGIHTRTGIGMSMGIGMGMVPQTASVVRASCASLKGFRSTKISVCQSSVGHKFLGSD